MAEAKKITKAAGAGIASVLIAFTAGIKSCSKTPSSKKIFSEGKRIFSPRKTIPSHGPYLIYRSGKQCYDSYRRSMPRKTESANEQAECDSRPQ